MATDKAGTLGSDNQGFGNQGFGHVEMGPEATVSHTASALRIAWEYLSERARTGNPLAWFIMKFREPHFEFAPGHVGPEDDPGELLQAPSKYGLENYRQWDLRLDEGGTVTAWYKSAAKGYPTIVYCHGNAGSLDARVSILKEMTDRGFGVIIAAYPGFKGHRERPKVNPSEGACEATGFAMARYLYITRRVPRDKIVLFGESLGGAVALKTAYHLEHGIPQFDFPPGKVPAVITYNTFTSLVKRAKEEFPMLPASALMENRFEADKIIGEIKAPILLLHGKADEYTPYRHSIELQKASGGRAALQLLDGVTHSATYPGTNRKDPQQVRYVIDCAHQYLYELGLCPPPQRVPGPMHEAGKTWSAGIRSSARHASEGWNL